MIYTSNHKTIGILGLKNTLAISGNKGASENYIGDSYPALAPRLKMWLEWHNNINKLSKEENIDFYINRYYEEVLKKLNPEELKIILEHKILVCYEEYNEFCHRQIVAAWLELNLDIEVPEIIVDNGKETSINRDVYYYRKLKPIIKN